MAYKMWVAECSCPEPRPLFMSQERAWQHEDGCAIVRKTLDDGEEP